MRSSNSIDLPLSFRLTNRTDRFLCVKRMIAANQLPAIHTRLRATFLAVTAFVVSPLHALIRHAVGPLAWCFTFHSPSPRFSS